MTREEKQLMLELFQKLIWAIGDLNSRGEDSIREHELEAIDEDFERLTQLIKESN